MTIDNLSDIISAAVDAAREAGLEELGCGRNRATYALGPRHVLKIPVNEDGMYDNSSEAEQWRRRREHSSFPIARCRILLNKDGLPLLVMERVVPTEPKPRPAMPDWVYSIDCQQVGYTRKGALVAYDFSRYEPELTPY